MSENSSKNIAILRREARRRRILENPENRLRSITGKTAIVSSESKMTNPETCFPDNHGEFHNSAQNDATNYNRVAICDHDSLNENFEPMFLGSLDSLRDEIHTKTHIYPENTFIQYLIRRRFHYIFLSLVVHCLFLYEFGFLFYDNIFCPFITVKLVESLTVQKLEQKTKSNLLNLVVCLSRGSMISYIVMAYSIIEMTVTDFLLYAFTIVLSEKLRNCSVPS